MFDFFKNEETINIDDFMTISFNQRKKTFKIIIRKDTDMEMQIQFRCDQYDTTNIKKIIAIQEDFKKDPKCIAKFNKLTDYLNATSYSHDVFMYLSNIYSKLISIIFNFDCERIKLLRAIDKFDTNFIKEYAEYHQDNKSQQHAVIFDEIFLILSDFTSQYFAHKRVSQDKNKLISDLKHQLDVKLALLKL